MFGSSEFNVDGFVDVLISGFPEYLPVYEPVQHAHNLLVEVNLLIGLQQVEDQDHIDDGEECNHNGTQQVQDHHIWRYAVVAQNCTLIIGDPVHQHHERLQEESE